MLKNKRVVCIGASTGIGLEVARQAIDHGADVTITGRSPKKLAAAKASIGGELKTFAFDGMDRGQVVEFFSRCGPMDHLVSMIGRTEWGTFLGLDESLARAVFEAKIWAQLFIVKTAHHLVARDGSITLTGGTSGDRGAYSYMGAAFSAMGNHALEAMVEGLSIELSPLRVNVVEPSLTDTPLWDSMDPSEKQQIYSAVAEQLQIKRVPTAVETARSYIHVMESGLINGDRVRPGGGPMFKMN